MGKGDAPGTGHFGKEGSKITKAVEELIRGFGTSRVEGCHFDISNHRSNFTNGTVRVGSRFGGTNIIEASEVEEDFKLVVVEEGSEFLGGCIGIRSCKLLIWEGVVEEGL